MLIFVFGSNLGGIHGKGAALYAKEMYGARIGEGIGRTGNSYAIPTKDKHLKVLPIEKIKPHVDTFLQYAKDNPHLSFRVTAIGCGLSGYKPDDIAPLFDGFPKNCRMPDEFKKILFELELTRQAVLSGGGDAIK